MSKNIEARQKIIKKCRKIVVKIGTRLLTDKNMIPALIAQIAKLRGKGYTVMLVSSGAVGMGMKVFKLKRRPSKLSGIQALAAVGQSKLMSLYEKECAKLGFHTAQLLLTAADLRERERHLNALNCINSLWNQNVLPIINENDSVSVDEIKFGDNDILAALLSVMTRSELTVLLTTVDGLHSVTGGKQLDKRISIVSEFSDELRRTAFDTDDCAFSIGGMSSKLRAAEIVTRSGEALWIADGRDPYVLEKIIAAQDVGTLFLPLGEKQMQSKKRWLSFFSHPSGKIIIDDGAVKALKQDGRSLLPAGIIHTKGNFVRGDTVEICDKNNNLVAKGLSNYNSEEVHRLAGLQVSELSKILGYEGDAEIVHRNNMALAGRA